MAIQPDPFFALPSLRGAPAYSRPPRRAQVSERPPDADDLPLASYQTDEERHLASALLASRGARSAETAAERTGEAGYRAGGGAVVVVAEDRHPQRRMNLHVLAERIRPRG